MPTLHRVCLGFHTSWDYSLHWTHVLLGLFMFAFQLLEKFPSSQQNLKISPDQGCVLRLYLPVQSTTIPEARRHRSGWYVFVVWSRWPSCRICRIPHRLDPFLQILGDELTRGDGETLERVERR
jgi:hypothetical protein